jgi:hypothetical protein
MDLALATTLNAVLMLALLGALAFAMSLAGRLKPHLSAAYVPALGPLRVARPVPAPGARSSNAAFAGTRP